jgi:hypothetical protein
MRLTLGIIIGSSFAAGVALLGCYRQSYDPSTSPNGGVTLTSGTYDTPPPRAPAAPGPADYVDSQGTATTNAATGDGKEGARAPVITTWGAGPARSSASSASTSSASSTDVSGDVADRAPMKGSSSGPMGGSTDGGAKPYQPQTP